MTNWPLFVHKMPVSQEIRKKILMDCWRVIFAVPECITHDDFLHRECVIHNFISYKALVH